jgi:RNA-binding protein
MLKNNQKKYLKALAHNKKPVVIIGNNGLTPAVLQEIDNALISHELIKVKVGVEDRTERDAMIQQIGNRLTAELVQRIGRIATLFRHHPETPRIQLPG